MNPAILTSSLQRPLHREVQSFAEADAAELHDYQLADKRAQSGKTLKELEHETFEIRRTRSSRSSEHDDSAEVTRIELANIGKIEVAGDQATAAFVRICRYDVVPCAGCNTSSTCIA